MSRLGAAARNILQAIIALIAVAAMPAGTGLVVLAQESDVRIPIDEGEGEDSATPDPEAEERRAEAAEAISTLLRLLSEKRQAEVEAEALRLQVESAADDVEVKELKQQREENLKKVREIEERVSALTTGATTAEFEKTGNENFELQSELQELLRPFVAMMRSATEGARQIEGLRSQLSNTKRRLVIAERALARLELLRAASSKRDADGRLANLVLDEQQKAWAKKLVEMQTLRDTTEQQLELKIEEQAHASDGIGTFVTEFLRSRGRNLVLGLGGFLAVLIVLGLIGRIVGYVARKRGLPRTFFTRLATIVFQAFTFLMATAVTLFIFNALNDWLLLGMTVVVILALAWIGVKMLPDIIQQLTLLLNLGAVQEGERVMIDDVPWRVDRLDHYTDLVNPALEGGEFTIPVRELAGRHSRPAAVGEVWFPTLKGDWLQLEDGRIAQVAIQTPELVELVELGGAHITYPTRDFVGLAPRNLSRGFRVEVTFGIDYRHQDIATGPVIEVFRAAIARGIAKLVGEANLKEVHVDILRAGESSIDYEVEVDAAGAAAHLAEDIEREMMRLLIETCTQQGWSIPFPQVVLNRARPARSQIAHVREVNGSGGRVQSGRTGIAAQVEPLSSIRG